MKKVTREAVRCFMYDEKKTTGNTTILVEGQVTKMLLHGNCIARTNPDKGGRIEISDAGWRTNTTKERLNAILDYCKVGRIYQKDFTWYWKDGEQFPDGWVAVK